MLEWYKMTARKLTNIEQILGQEMKLYSRIECGIADESDYALLRHYEAIRKKHYRKQVLNMSYRKIREANDTGAI